MDTSLNDASVKKFFDDNFVICHLVYLIERKEILKTLGIGNA
jgi:hypothetical protein